MLTGNLVKDKNDSYHMSTAVPDLLFRKNSKYDSFAMSTGTPEVSKVAGKFLLFFYFLFFEFLFQRA
jgi:hypothetical protein